MPPFIEKLRGKIDSAKKAIKAVDWKAKFLFLLQTIILVALLALHIYSTVDNFRNLTGVKHVCLITTLAALISAYFLFRAFGPGKAATVIFSLFVAPIAFSAIYFGGGNLPGFVLAGRETGFWANASCLGTIVVLLGWLFSRQIKGGLKLALAVPLLYCSLGFAVGILRGAPLDLAILGTGFLRNIPFEFQPASLYLNLVLPLVLIVLFLQGLKNLFSGESDLLPENAALGIFFLLPFVMGIATMNRYLIPNVSFLLLGKPIGIGRTQFTYISPWDTKKDGSKTHEIVVQTASYKEGKEPNYEISASVIPPVDFEKKTLLKVSVMDKNRRDVLNLTRDDFVVFEDGEKQDHELVSKLDRKALDLLVSTSIVLDLDVSGSMSGKPIEGLQTAALAFVGKLVPAYEVELITFSSTIDRKTNGFVRDRSLLEGLVKDLQSGGGTSLYDSIFAAFNDIENKKSGRGILVLFSDGGDSGHGNSLEATFDRIRGKGIQIFAVGFGAGTSEKSGSGKILKELADLTGGKFFHADDIADIDKIFNQIFEFISCKYEMEYQKGLPPPPTISVSQPKKQEVILKPFDVSVSVQGRVERVELFLDRIPLKTFSEKREGTFTHRGENPEDHDPGKHEIIGRVQDMFGRSAEDKIEVVFKREVAQIRILKPTEGVVIWEKGIIEAGVRGKHFKEIKFFIDDKEVKSFPAQGTKYSFDFLASNLKEGLHTVRAEVIMPDGRKGADMTTFRSIIPRPKAQILTPGKGDRVFSGVPISFDAESGWKETKFKADLFIDGKLVKTFSVGPYRYDWHADEFPEGSHEVKVVVENELGDSVEDKVSVEVFKPQFSVVINGITSGQVLHETTGGSLSIVNTKPGTRIEKVVISIDDDEYATLTLEPWKFKIDINKLKPGRHEVKATAFRSDGETFVNRFFIDVQPPRKINLFFSVKDDKGRYVPSEKLKELKLWVKEDGKSVQDFSFDSAADLPVSFGMVIDVSGSMNDEHKMDRAKDAAVLFIKMMKSNDKAFIIKFSDSPELARDLTGDQTQLLQEIEYLVPKKATALYDAVHMAVERIQRVRDRPAFLVLTDGIDQNLTGTGPGSVKTLPEVVEMSRREDVQIFTVGLGRELLMNGSRGENVLKQLSSQTGGSYFFAPSGAQLMEIFRTIIREVGSQSKLSFVPPSGANDEKWHTVEIGVPARPDLKFIYKPTYLAK